MHKCAKLYKKYISLSQTNKSFINICMEIRYLFMFWVQFVRLQRCDYVPTCWQGADLFKMQNFIRNQLSRILSKCKSCEENLPINEEDFFGDIHVYDSLAIFLAKRFYFVYKMRSTCIFSVYQTMNDVRMVDNYCYSISRYRHWIALKFF